MHPSGIKTDCPCVYFFSRPYLQVDLDTSLVHYGLLVVSFLRASFLPRRFSSPKITKEKETVSSIIFLTDAILCLSYLSFFLQFLPCKFQLSGSSIKFSHDMQPLQTQKSSQKCFDSSTTTLYLQSCIGNRASGRCTISFQSRVHQRYRRENSA